MAKRLHSNFMTNNPLTFLCLFAHPDDETVSCAGTIKQLTAAGHKVIVVSLTDGSAGEVMPRAQAALTAAGSIGELRRQELAAASKLLGVAEWRVLDFVDGQITNQTVWGKLTVTCVELIDTYKPDCVITFDHSGWYFHLDHVGVSIAATLAVAQAQHQPDLFFHSHVRVNQSRWKYVFHYGNEITHVVDATAERDIKLAAIAAHDSQDITTIITHVKTGERHEELFELVLATETGKNWLQAQPIFRPTQTTSSTKDL